MTTIDPVNRNASKTGYASKRALDIVLASLLAIPALAAVGVCAVVIRLESGANPFFVQNRVGFDRRVFRLVKLRTMPVNTAELPSHQVGAHRRLKSGSLFRKLKLDELPQIWNVLNGDMSFVGPRPCLPMQSELIEARDALGVYGLKPGITGRSQIAGIDMSTPAKLASSDQAYINESSLLCDLRILARTFLGAGRGDATKT